MVAEGGHEIAEKFNSPDAADRAEQENATKRKSASISIGEAKFEARGVDEPKQTKTRLFAADTRSLRPWPMVEEIKEVKVERREEEKRQSWQKGQNHAHSRPLFFPSPLRSLPSSSSSLPYRVCVVRYSTARYSATACAFDFSAYSRTCVEKHNVHRFFLCAAMYLRVYHFGIILFGSATARHTLAASPIIARCQGPSLRSPVAETSSSTNTKTIPVFVDPRQLQTRDLCSFRRTFVLIEHRSPPPAVTLLLCTRRYSF